MLNGIRCERKHGQIALKAEKCILHAFVLTISSIDLNEDLNTEHNCQIRDISAHANDIRFAAMSLLTRHHELTVTNQPRRENTSGDGVLDLYQNHSFSVLFRLYSQKIKVVSENSFRRHSDLN